MKIDQLVDKVASYFENDDEHWHQQIPSSFQSEPLMTGMPTTFEKRSHPH